MTVIYNHVSQMEPLYPARSESLENFAWEVVAVSARLGRPPSGGNA
jgi:hypothetical protein